MNTEVLQGNGSSSPKGKPVMVVERTFIESLPEELREEDSLGKFKDVAGLAKSYLHLESKLGGERLAVPDEADAEGWNRLYGRLGRPENPDGYDLGSPEQHLPQGQLTEEHLSWFRSLAHKWGLNPRQARGMFQEYLALVRQGMDKEAAMLRQFRDQEIQVVQKILADAFGPAAQEKMGLLKKVVAKFGGPELEAFLSEEGNLDPRLVLALIRVGEGLGEDTLAGGLSHQQVSEAERARSEIKRLQGDKTFRDAYYDKADPGHDQAVERMTRLFEAAHPEN